MSRMRANSVRRGVVVGVLIAVVSASAAVAYIGTSAGKKLAGQMLSSYKHVRYLAGSEHGSVYYCTSGLLEGFLVGPKYSPCPVKATVSWVATMSNGKGSSAVGKVVAHGHPTIDWVANRRGSFYRVSGTSCWVTSNRVDATYVGSPPFGYFPKEYLAIGSHRGSNVQLNGTIDGMFKETDTINSHTHHIVGESIHFNIKSKTEAWNLITSYSEPSKGPAVPSTTPAC
jgi:hypothetical protein